MKTWQLALVLFVSIENVLLLSVCVQAKHNREDAEDMSHLTEQIDHSLDRIEKNLDQIQRNLQGIQGPRWACIMEVDAGNGSEACVWIDKQSRGWDRDARP